MKRSNTKRYDIAFRLRAVKLKSRIRLFTSGHSERTWIDGYKGHTPMDNALQKGRRGRSERSFSKDERGNKAAQNAGKRTGRVACGECDIEVLAGS